MSVFLCWRPNIGLKKSEIILKYIWNSSEICLKYFWNIPDIFLKYFWLVGILTCFWLIFCYFPRLSCFSSQNLEKLRFYWTFIFHFFRKKADGKTSPHRKLLKVTSLTLWPRRPLSPVEPFVGTLCCNPLDSLTFLDPSDPRLSIVLGKQLSKELKDMSKDCSLFLEGRTVRE